MTFSKYFTSPFCTSLQLFQNGWLQFSRNLTFSLFYNSTFKIVYNYHFWMVGKSIVWSSIFSMVYKSILPGHGYRCRIVECSETESNLIFFMLYKSILVIHGYCFRMVVCSVTGGQTCVRPALAPTLRPSLEIAVQCVMVVCSWGDGSLMARSLFLREGTPVKSVDVWYGQFLHW